MATRSDRQVLMEGSTAHQWMERSGITVESADSLRIAGDIIERDQSLLMRQWHSPASVVFTPISTRRTVWFIFPVDGFVEYQSSGPSTISNAREEWLVVDSIQMPTLHNARGFAYVAFRSEWSKYTDSIEILERQLGAKIPWNDFASSIVNLSMSILNSKISPSESSSIYAFRAIEEWFRGALVEALHSPMSFPAPGSRAGEVSTLRRALAIMEYHYSEPGFNVMHLASQLGVSVRYLNRSFSSAGTTPRRYLEQLRARAALSLSQGADCSREEIAKRAGFSSIRSLQRAMQRVGSSSPDPELLFGSSEQAEQW